MPLDPLSDPRFFECLERSDLLYIAFAQRSGTGVAPTTTGGLLAILGILRDVNRLHPVCSQETEEFLVGELGAEVDDPLTFSRIEELFNAVVHFQAAEDLSHEERAVRFPKANALDDDGRPALLVAVQDDDLALTEMLLQCGADPNSVPEGSGHTPLFVACAANRPELVRTLTLAGALPHARIDRMGATPLYIACHKGYAAVVDELLMGGADPDRPQRDGSTGLHIASKGSHAEVVRVLLANGATANVRTNKGFTPIHRAVCAHATAAHTMVGALLDARADVDGADPSGKTPLHGAVEAANDEAAALLLAAGADADARNILDEGNTPLLRAVGIGAFGAAKALLVAKADPSRANASGVTPLQIGRMRSQLSAHHHAEGMADGAADGELKPSAQRELDAATAMLDLLLDFGAPYDVRTTSGKTPLYLAAQLGQMDEVSWLLGEGAAVDRPIGDGASPLQVACQQGHVDVARVLIEHGACPRGQREMSEAPSESYGRPKDVFGSGFPPLHLACLGMGGIDAACEIVSMLIEAAADPNETCANGNTPLRILAMEASLDDGVRMSPPPIAGPGSPGERISCEASPGSKLDWSPRPPKDLTRSPDGVLDLPPHSLGPASDDGMTMMSGVEGDDTASGTVDDDAALGGGVHDAFADADAIPVHVTHAESTSHISRIVSVLLAARADPSAPDTSGRTAVWLATNFGAHELLRCIVGAAGDAAHHADKMGVPPLWVAAARGHAAAAATLLHHSADANACDRHDCPPLCVACQQGEMAIVRLLLEHGVDVERTDAYGNTPILLASQQGHLPCVNALLHAGASADTANDQGIAPLQAAFDEGYSSTVAALKDAGADTSVMDAKGKRRFEHPMHSLTHFIESGFGHVPTYMPPDPDGVSAARLLDAPSRESPLALAYERRRPREPMTRRRWADSNSDEMLALAAERRRASDGGGGDEYGEDFETEAPAIAPAVAPTPVVEPPAQEISLGDFPTAPPAPGPVTAKERRAALAAKRAALEQDRANLQKERELRVSSTVVRFQARLRGYKTRKEQAARRDAAVCVQAATRGRAARRERRTVADDETGLLDESAAAAADAPDAAAEDDADDEVVRQDKAAVAVQAAVRGRAARLGIAAARPATPVDD